MRIDLRLHTVCVLGKTSFNYVEDIADIVVNSSLAVENNPGAHVLNIR